MAHIYIHDSFTYIHTYIYTYIHIFTYPRYLNFAHFMYPHGHVIELSRSYIYIYIYIYIYTHTHTYIHTNMTTQVGM